jgi:hypothetical protein
MPRKKEVVTSEAPVRAVRPVKSKERHRKAAPSETGSTPSSEDVARLAYSLWEERGCPPDSAEEDWFRAEAQLAVRAGS